MLPDRHLEKLLIIVKIFIEWKMREDLVISVEVLLLPSWLPKTKFPQQHTVAENEIFPTA